MPTVKVNGNLEAALAEFKQRQRQEGTLVEVRRRMAFIPRHEERAMAKYQRDLKRKQKQRAERRK